MVRGEMPLTLVTLSNADEVGFPSCFIYSLRMTNPIRASKGSKQHAHCRVASSSSSSRSSYLLLPPRPAATKKSACGRRVREKACALLHARHPGAQPLVIITLKLPPRTTSG